MSKNITNYKILISCGSYSWGGLEMVALQFAEKLQKYGSDVMIICSYNSRFKKEAENKNLEAIPVFSTNKKIPSAITKLKKILENFKPDVVHTHLSHDLWVITPALNLAGSRAKVFLTKHMASGVKKTDIAHRYLYKRVNGIFAISNYIKESVINTCPVPTENIHLLPNGIDVNEYDNKHNDKITIKKSLGIPDDKLIISIIGRLTIGKGHEEFLNAAKIINDKYLNKVFFVVAGGPSYGEEEYEEKIKKLSLELNIPNILFTGYFEDISQILNVTDILAFPSHNESFGVTLLEAMAMKVPIAASGYAGVLDIITDNETGLLFEPRNYTKLSETLIKLIDDAGLRHKLGNAGRKHVEEKFNIDTIINKLLEYYSN